MTTINFCPNGCSPRMRFENGQYICPTCECVLVVNTLTIGHVDPTEMVPTMVALMDLVDPSLQLDTAAK